MAPTRQPGRAVPGPSQGALSGLQWWPFIILAGAGAVIFLSGRRQGPATGPLTMVWALTLTMGLAVAVTLEVMARTCVARQRLAAGFDASPAAARAILDATAGLTRVVSLAISVFMSLLVVPQAWLPGFGATLNFAHVRAWLILGAILVLPLGAVAVGLVSALCR
jgi:hypothetical protein